MDGGMSKWIIKWRLRLRVDAYNACIKLNYISQKTNVSREHLDSRALLYQYIMKNKLLWVPSGKEEFLSGSYIKLAYPTQWIITAAHFYWALTRFWALAQHFDTVFWFKCLLTPVNCAHTVRSGQNFSTHFLCRRAANTWGQEGRPEALAASLSQGVCLFGAPPPWPVLSPGCALKWLLCPGPKSQVVCRCSIRMSGLQNSLLKRVV